MYELFILLFVIAFVTEFAAAALGMGYGTTLAPIMLVLGYSPVVLVPIILFSQFISAFVAAVFHHRFRNMDIMNQEDEKTAFKIFTVMGILGVIVAIFANINLPELIVKWYIAIVVMLMGLLMLLNGKRDLDFSRPRLAFIGVIAAFNKGISGGGYGPVTNSGQILSGIRPRAALAITALVEGVICAFGISLYFLLLGPPLLFETVAITAGALVAAPLSALVTSKLQQPQIKMIVAISTLAIGLVTLLWIAFSVVA
ncbi:MAG: sulfite exporter TauE/SafE family protein [Candidatus Thorarchaeota archaeon]